MIYIDYCEFVYPTDVNVFPIRYSLFPIGYSLLFGLNSYCQQEFVVSNMAASPSEREVLKELATQTDGQAAHTHFERSHHREIGRIYEEATTGE